MRPCPLYIQDMHVTHTPAFMHKDAEYMQNFTLTTSQDEDENELLQPILLNLESTL